MLYQLCKEQQMSQRSSMKVASQKPLQKLKKDCISRDTRLRLQNDTYAAAMSLFTSGIGNANFWETCFSLLVSKICLHHHLFPTISSITKKDTQKTLLSFRAAIALRKKISNLHRSCTFCCLCFTCKRGSDMLYRCVPCVLKIVPKRSAE